MRLFTLEEARALLPRVRPLLERIAQAARELRQLQSSTLVAARASLADGNLVADPFDEGAVNRLEELEAIIQEGLRACAGAGIEVKDIERGLIDFRHEREGRVVYLCYELGEEDIDWWHPIETGFAGRQRI